MFKFVTEMFKDCLPHNDLLHVLSQCCEKYPQEIKQLITHVLKKLQMVSPTKKELSLVSVTSSAETQGLF